MPHSALRGLCTNKYLSMCVWRKRDDCQPVSCVWSPGIKHRPAQWHPLTQAMTSTHTHTNILSLCTALLSPNQHCVSLSLTALSANSCQWHHPLGTVVSFMHTVIRQLASSAFSCLYLDDSLHPNELCQNGIWHKPSIKHSWQTLRVRKSRLSMAPAPHRRDNSHVWFGVLFAVRMHFIMYTYSYVKNLVVISFVAFHKCTHSFTQTYELFSPWCRCVLQILLWSCVLVHDNLNGKDN